MNREFLTYRFRYYQAMLGFMVGFMGVSVIFSLGPGLLQRADLAAPYYTAFLICLSASVLAMLLGAASLRQRAGRVKPRLGLAAVFACAFGSLLGLVLGLLISGLICLFCGLKFTWPLGAVLAALL